MKTSVLLAFVLALAGACSSSTAERPSTNDEREGWIDRDRERAEGRGDKVAESDVDDVDGEHADADRDHADHVGVDHDRASVDRSPDGVAAVDDADDTDEHADENNDAAKHEPDNTGRNARDDQPGKLTALDQSNSKSDVDITQAIRKKVIADDALSFNAKNVKIITVAGKVTLRGPVESAKESAAIEKSARAVAGVVQVDNQIEVER